METEQMVLDEIKRLREELTKAIEGLNIAEAKERDSYNQLREIETDLTIAHGKIVAFLLERGQCGCECYREMEGVKVRDHCILLCGLVD